jgi:outer membrane protein assembly factor BamE
MNRAQVRDVLGSPLLTDVFHADRWDYVFTIRRQGADRRRAASSCCSTAIAQEHRHRRRLPSEREFVASIDTFKTSRNAPPLELTPEQAKALPAPDAAARRSNRRADRTYPPLEPTS